MLIQFSVGLALAAVISYLAHRFHSLTRRGAYGSTLLGAIVFGLGGWQWAILLLAFFIASSLLTRAFGASKSGISEKYAKGGERDEAQVFSNGGVAGLFAMLHAAYPGQAWPWLGFTGALAAVNADTWATELGVLDPNGPRLITALRSRAEKGTSGAVSLGGIGASLLASVLIGLLACLLYASDRWPVFIAVSAAGIVGSLIDSILGATVQALYYCPVDQKETERHPLHTCGTRTFQIRGWKWLNNDWVNVICSATGSLIAELLLAILL